MTQIELKAEEPVDGEKSQTSMHYKSDGILEKSYADYSASKQAQIQKKKLQFLKKCKYNKRPPTSLRIQKFAHPQICICIFLWEM